jgi:hypothetical protein
MIFSDLYYAAEASGQVPVGFDFLRAKVAIDHQEIQRVDVFAITYQNPTRQAHWRLGADRTSPYDDEFVIAEIRHCEALADDEADLRFALTKELMHAFDTPEERVDTAEKFRQLLHEIQNRPLNASAMYQSEINTRWMALLVLCPKTFRDPLVADYKAGKLADFDIAAKFRVPEWVVPSVMDDYYVEVHRLLVK